MNARPRRTTISDVARRAGVSKSAVSHVFNGRDDIAPQTRQRILDAADELGWLPAASASALAVSRTATVGYVVAGDPERLRLDPFFVDVITGVQTVLTSRGYNLLVRIVRTEEEELETYRRLVSARQVDGVMLINHQRHDRRYRLLKDAGIPAVAIGRPWRDCPFPHVAPADDAGLVAAIELLAAQGHRRIAYVAGPAKFAHSAYRQRLFGQVMARLNLPVPRPVRTDYAEAAAKEVTTALLRRRQRPTAIVYSNDWLALWGMSAVAALGLDVPGDVSVVGHDNLPVAAWAHPPLTTVGFDVAELADVAATTLLDLVDGKDPDPPETSPTKLVARSSTAPPPALPV